LENYEVDKFIDTSIMSSEIQAVIKFFFKKKPKRKNSLLNSTTSLKTKLNLAETIPEK
jgi:hypothetical protein